MFEKIKDFLYDISDIFVSLLIIGVIFFAVSWKISDTLSVDINAPQTTSETSATTEGQIVVTPVDSTEATSAGEAGTTEATATTEASTEATTEAPTEAPTQAATTPGALETFVVGDGELGYTIGKNLESQGFIADRDEFVKRLIEMGYDSKLQAGTYKVSKTDSLETIIKVLAGEGR